VPDQRGEITLELKTIFKWAGQLEEGRKYAMIAYLFWASDVISENKNDTIDDPKALPQGNT
jgi:hypothetical protein